MRRTLSLAALLLLSSAAGAQHPDTARVSATLANQLLGFAGMMGGSAVIVSGRLPTERMASLIPQGAMVLGGANYLAGRDTVYSLAVAAMREQRDQAKDLVRRHLASRGWKEPDMSRFGGNIGGLVAIGVPTGDMQSYCSDSASAGVSVVDDPNGGSIVRITATPSVKRSLCDTDFHREMMGGVDRDRIEMPTLRPPDGVRATSAGSGGSEDSYEWHVRYDSPLAVEQIVSHFVPQLQEQGWTLGTRSVAADFTVVTARKTDAKGRPLHLMLTDYRWSPRDHEVLLRVWRRSER